MTNQESINILLNERKCIDRNDGNQCDRKCESCDLVMDAEQIREAYSMAISALEAQDAPDTNVGTSKYTVSATAVEEMLKDLLPERGMWEIEGDEAKNAVCETVHDALEGLWKLPFAQQEIAQRKPVVGYEGYYEVDIFGRVYALDRVIHVDDNGRKYDKPLKGGIMKQRLHSDGYKIVSLTKNGKTKNAFVHRIVAMAFLPNPDNLPCINHKDEDKTNNFIENLEWCTYQYNNAYGSKPRKHSKWMTGRKLSDEHKQHISEGHKKYWDKIRAERRENEATKGS